MRYLLSLIVAVILCGSVWGEETDGKASLKKGRNELDAGKYSEAIADLTRAERDFPLLGDYALMWLSDAFHGAGDHARALETIRSLLTRYPQSPLLQRARIREVQEAQHVPGENALKLFEAYTTDYPSDTEMKYLFALSLQENGQRTKAKDIFRDIYRHAREFSVTALQQLDHSDIGVEDMLKHATSHIAQMNYQTAEAALKSALAKDDGRLRTEILKELGIALFRQKRYREAAESFRQAGERYWEIRSLYRSGAKESLKESLDTILRIDDKRIGSVLLSLAADTRRDGNVGEAIALYQAVREKYPSEAEEALWGIGWTHFLAGEYEKSSDLFSRLSVTYRDPKYAYWKARSLELSGKEAPPYDGGYPLKGRPDYYRMLLAIRNESRSQQPDSASRRVSARSTAHSEETPMATKKNDRIEQLIDLGFEKEAVSEMMHASNRIASREELLYLCTRLQEFGQYPWSVRIASRIPDVDAVRQCVYPFAYKDLVEASAARHSVDPLLVLAVMREESRFDREARSPAGALGLLQLMPATAFRLDRSLRVGIRHPHDLTDAAKNLELGIHYLSALLREFGSYPIAIAAYNAGEETVRKWLKRGNYRTADEFIEDIPYEETRNYVKKVLVTFFEYARGDVKNPRPFTSVIGKI